MVHRLFLYAFAAYLPSLAHTRIAGLLCDIDYLYGEHGSKKFLNEIAVLGINRPDCKFRYQHIDDESYHDSNHPLPTTIESLAVTAVTSITSTEVVESVRDLSIAKLADGCRHVYLDLGSNAGIQIRKLYEPSRYPGAAIQPVFDRMFGNDRASVCTFAFEPNPVFHARLTKLQESYQAAGWKVKVFLSAVSNYEGKSQFTRVTSQNIYEWGSYLGKGWSAGIPITVDVMNFTQFFVSEIKGRTVPDGYGGPSVVVKSNMWGHDDDVWLKMIDSGMGR